MTVPLLNDDIWHHIVSRVSSHGALAVLARTSHSLFHVASGALWKDDVTLLSLVKTFGPETFQKSKAVCYDPCEIASATSSVVSKPGQNTDWRFICIPTPESWSRFLLYAQKVHSMSSAGYYNMNLSVLRVLGFHRPQLCLTPNLKSLNWHPATKWTSGVLLFLSPTMQYLNANPSDPNKFLSMVVPLVPMLTAIDLTCFDLYSINEVATKLSKLPQIQRIRLKGKTTEIMAGLTRLASNHHLKELDLEIGIGSSLPTALPARSFMGLQSLVLACSSQLAANAVRCIAGASTSHLDITFRNEVGTPVLISVFEAIRQLQNHTHLHIICIRIPTELEPTSVSMDDMQPLLHLPELKQLTFGGLCKLDLTDTDIELLTRSWPSLTHLHLEHAGDVKLTLHGLIHLVGKLSHLQDLIIAVDATSVPHTDYTSTTIYPRLLSLRLVSDADIGDPAVVARFLSFAFPNVLLTVSSSPGAEATEADGEKWKQVKRLVPIFQAVRREDELRFRCR